MKKKYFNRELSWIRFNGRCLEEAANPHAWKNPIWRLEDGAVAEW